MRLKSRYSSLLIEEENPRESGTITRQMYQVVENERYNLMRLTFANLGIYRINFGRTIKRIR
jgi:hypothetical protein